MLTTPPELRGNRSARGGNRYTEQHDVSVGQKWGRRLCLAGGAGAGGMRHTEGMQHVRGEVLVERHSAGHFHQPGQDGVVDIGGVKIRAPGDC